MADLVGIPPVPIRAGSINFGDSKEKRQSTFKVIDCPVVDPNKVFGQESSVVSRSSSFSLTNTT
jgi:hypothetical protein